MDGVQAGAQGQQSCNCQTGISMRHQPTRTMHVRKRAYNHSLFLCYTRIYLSIFLLSSHLTPTSHLCSYKSPREAYVEGDASSASYFLAGATITGGTVTVEGCGSESLQGDKRFAGGRVEGTGVLCAG